jgi:hypothetical protein
VRRIIGAALHFYLWTVREVQARDGVRRTMVIGQGNLDCIAVQQWVIINKHLPHRVCVPACTWCVHVCTMHLGSVLDCIVQTLCANGLFVIRVEENK